MENKRKSCKECPWKNENQHSLKFRNYVYKMTSIGKIDKVHACHMTTTDVWGYNSDISKKNHCIGSVKNKKIHD